MSEPFSFGGIETHLVSRGAEFDARPEAEEPFRVLLVGDFAGRASRGGPVEAGELSARRPVLVDRDNLDDVMRHLGVRLRLAAGGPAPDLYFDALEDFHPDRLYERLEIFRALRRTRRKLQDPSTFEEAAAEVRRWTPTRESDAATPHEATPPGPAAPHTSARPDESAGPSSRDLIAQMLDAKAASAGGPAAAGSSEPAAGVPPESSSDFARFLREVVGPHVVADTGAREEELTRAVDEAVAASMRAVLHHPDFQSLEAAWRGVRFLTHNLDTGPHLKLYLLDLTRDELAADLRSSDDLTRTALYRLLVEQTVGTPGGEPWALLAGVYTFDAVRADAELLGRLAKLAHAAGAPFVAGAAPRVVGCASLADSPDPDDWRAAPAGADAEAWRALRRLPEAAHLGLALPRFLLRLPYGADTDPVDGFDFEETPGEPPHESYLWGNPAFALAYLLAEGFGRDGWSLRPGDVQSIDGLPLHVFEAGGERQTKPCAEVLLGESAARAVLERGPMPLLSFKDRDEVRLARLQSLSDPPSRLAGRWN